MKNNFKAGITNLYSKRFIRIPIIIFITIQIILNALSYNIDKQTYNIDYYSEYSKEYNIKDYAGVNQKNLEEMYTKLILYIKNGFNFLLEDFNDRETRHMEDVHQLYVFKDKITLTTTTIILSIIILLFGSQKIRKENIKFFIITFISIFVILGILLIIIYLDFDEAFIKFHKIFFDNDLWILDPRTDIMIRMLPQDYFMQLTFKIFIGFIKDIFLIIFMFLGISKLRTNFN